MKRLREFRARLRLSTRFALMAGTIACAFCLGAALLLYAYLKEKVIQDTYQRGQIVYAIMDATGKYANETMRPRLLELMSGISDHDFFIAEAMSTTRMRHGIMTLVNEKNPEFLYRRVSPHPRNPENHLDPIHRQRFTEFTSLDKQSIWRGVWRQDGAQYYYIVRPVYVKAECLKCHGEPELAPAGLVRLYGAENGFGYHEGDFMGMESISISLSPALAEIRQIAMHVFTIGICAMLCLFVAIEGTFINLVGKPLRHLASRFEEIVAGTRPIGEAIPIEIMDEIGELTSSFNTMGRHLAEAQDTLEANTRILQSIIDGISDPLALVNPDGYPAVLNQAYQSWFAHLSPTVLQSNGAEKESCEGDASPGSMLREAFTEARAVSGAWTGPNGRCYLMDFYPILNEAGQAAQMVQYIRDITAAKQAESRMMHIEKMVAIGQLSAGVAHEINNPLSTILCYTKLLERDLPAENPAVQDVQVIDRNARACKEIVDGLLSFAHRGAPAKEVGSLNEGLMTIAGVVENQFKKDGITLDLRLDPQLPAFRFDHSRMEQVYVNLLMNARQAMTQGGIVSITTCYHARDRLAEIRIQDTGSGIESEHLDQIFNPFFTTKKTGEGTGLGLSISYGIVEEHGGKINVVSAPNAGSTFIITLPMEGSDEKAN